MYLLVSRKCKYFRKSISRWPGKLLFNNSLSQSICIFGFTEVYIWLNLLICYNFNKLIINYITPAVQSYNHHEFTLKTIGKGKIIKVLTCIFFNAFSLFFTALGRLKMKKQIRAVSTVLKNTWLYLKYPWIKNLLA